MTDTEKLHEATALKWQGGGGYPLVPHVSYTMNSEGHYSDNKEEAKEQFFAMLDEWAVSRGIISK